MLLWGSGHWLLASLRALSGGGGKPALMGLGERKEKVFTMEVVGMLSQPHDRYAI